MGYRVVFAPEAHARLGKIVRFIAQDDPEAAIRFGDYLVDRAESLAQFPELGTRIANARTFAASCASRT